MMILGQEFSSDFQPMIGKIDIKILPLQRNHPEECKIARKTVEKSSETLLYSNKDKL
jgi:hypothetical protein